MDFETLHRNLISTDPWDVLVRVIDRNIPLLVELNKGQLSKGQMSDGTNTPSHSGGAASEIYVDSKIERGVYPESLYPLMNFYNTGDFYDRLIARAVDSGITFWSEDDKSDMLETKYGSQIYGLTEENINVFIEMIVDQYIIELENELLKE